MRRIPVAKYSNISTEELVQPTSTLRDVAAWEEFVQRFHRLIATVVLRTAARWGDCSNQTADDLIQETYLKLCGNNCRIIKEFEHRQPEAFVGYVKVITANVVHDHFKALNSKRRGANQVAGMAEDFVPVAGDDSAGSAKAIERAVLLEEIQRQLDRCVSGADRDRNSRIFWLYFRVGLSAGAIAALPGIGLTTKGVESLILRITRELRERMAIPKSRLREDLKGSGEGILSAESF